MKPKHIGLVGGLAPESTLEYYRTICSEYNKRFGGLHFPQVSIRSVNLQEVFDLFSANRWDEMADVIVAAILDLQRSGADFAAIATNTPHNAHERIRQNSPLEVLSIMDATASEIQRDGSTKVGLLGTKPTMEYGFFQRTFRSYGIDTITPDQEERSTINQIIWDELIHGMTTLSSRQKYKSIIAHLVDSGAQGVILGCTEIPLLIIKIRHSELLKIKDFQAQKSTIFGIPDLKAGYYGYYAPRLDWRIFSLENCVRKYGAFHPRNFQ